MRTRICSGSDRRQVLDRRKRLRSSCLAVPEAVQVGASSHWCARDRCGNVTPVPQGRTWPSSGLSRSRGGSPRPSAVSRPGSPRPPARLGHKVNPRCQPEAVKRHVNRHPVPGMEPVEPERTGTTFSGSSRCAKRYVRAGGDRERHVLTRSESKRYLRRDGVARAQRFSTSQRVKTSLSPWRGARALRFSTTEAVVRPSRVLS